MVNKIEQRIIDLAKIVQVAQERARNERSKGVVNDKKPHPKVRLWPNDLGAIMLSPDYNTTPKDRGDGYAKYIDKIKKRKKKKVE
jgi:hypothetical protein